ncbi:MAG: TRAP transporter large permease [Chloroflexi bacterium]|nr:TRAP transporter large permease [Chloroflexota bacterium]
MEWGAATVAIIASIVVAVILGIPVGVSLGAVSIIFLLFISNMNTVMSVVATEFVGFWSSYTMIALPLFILMGEFLFVGGVSQSLFDFAAKWLQRIRGGLAMVAIGTGALFATISGSGLAGIATVGVLTGPEMLNRGYDKRLASGAIAAGGGLAHLIPPSVMAVLYAGLVEVSVGRQLMAGFIPGVVLTVIYAVYVLVWVRINPSAAPVEPPVPWKERFAALRRLLLPMSVAVVVLGCIYTGVTTATEAAGIGALMAIVIAVAVRKIGLAAFWSSGMAAVRTTAFIMLIGVGGKLLGWSLQYYLIPQNLVEALTALDLNRYVIMILIMLVLFVLGMFMDAVSIVVVTMPILLPLLNALHFNLMWFGVILLLNLEVGLITPPVALALYTIKGVLGEKISLNDVFRGGFIFFTADILLIALLIVFPSIVTWLPDKMIAP